MSDPYEVIAWSACSFIAGTGIGGYLVTRLRGMAVAAGARRGLFAASPAWARESVGDSSPVKETFVRKDFTGEHPTDELIFFDGKSLTFSVETIAGQRDMGFRAREVYSFFRCDTPARSEFRGANSAYSDLLQVARSYKWVLTEARGASVWAPFLGTPERRVRTLRGWCERG